MANIFWLDDPTVLYKKYTDILPVSEMSRVEQLNAISRFAFYMIIFLLMFGRSSYVYVPVILLIIVVILYYVYKGDPDGGKKENTIKRKRVEDNLSKNSDVINIVGPKYEIEAGSYDSDGNVVYGKEYSSHSKKDRDLAYTLDEVIDYDRATCKKPTKDNPFMNPIVTEYNTDDPPQACNADDEDIKDMIEKKFSDGLYMDIDDLYNLKSTQRNFYTVPVPAIPPDSVAFAQWLNRRPLTCKENQEECLQYEDLRYKR